MIHINNISKSFGKGHSSVKVLDDISASITAQSLNVILGRSGSGKSTLLNLIAGLEKPDFGSIEILNQKATAFTPEQFAAFRLKHIGLVFQFFNLLPTLNLEDNIALAGHLNMLPKSVIRERVQSALEKVGLVSEAGRMPHEASGGEIQRAAIARALINEPDIILADEPTGNLDAKNRESVAAIFKDLVDREGKTVLIVTHDASFEDISDHIFRIKNGRLSA